MVIGLYDEFVEKFANRLAQLRIQKNISARNMSLSLGRDDGYIGKIERKIFLPSMAEFYYICEFLGTSPKDFLNDGITYPSDIGEILDCLKKLDEEHLFNIKGIVRSLSSDNKKTGD